MEGSQYNTCSFMDRTYSHDAEVCGDDKCMICNNGKWEDAIELFPPKKSGILSP
jgi:hypothetical protein